MAVEVEGSHIDFKKGRYTNMTVEVALVISVVSVAFSIFFGLKNSKRSDTKDIEERVKGDTRINMKLDNIAIVTQDIKSDIALVKEETNSLNSRVIKVEESVKQAHHRINDFADRLNMKDGG